MRTYRQEAKILWNREIAPGLYRLGLETPAMAAGADPGCFVMVRASGPGAPLLRRPFSVHGLIEGRSEAIGIEILYRVVGPGTARMAACAGGDCLDVVGPLGRGFRLAGPSERVVIAGGGIGVAPLVFLARQLVRKRGGAGGMAAFVGAGSENEVIGVDEFRALGIEPVVTTTDDGSCGLQCRVTEPLDGYIERQCPDMVYACGPTAMLRCVAQLASEHRIACQVSVETMMACGMGACLGCAMKSTAPGVYLHACTDGPVFDAGRLRL